MTSPNDPPHEEQGTEAEIIPLPHLSLADEATAHEMAINNKTRRNNEIRRRQEVLGNRIISYDPYNKTMFQRLFSWLYKSDKK